MARAGSRDDFRTRNLTSIRSIRAQGLESQDVCKGSDHLRGRRSRNGRLILLRGDVTIYIAFGTTHQRTVTELKPGQMFGVHALMAGAHRKATAVTAQGCDVLAVSEAKLKQKLDEADPFLRYWVDYLSKRVIDLSAQ